MTIYGWDASHYDWDRGPMDITSAVRSGISFLTHKASEGTSYTDPKYGAAAGRAHGVVPLFGAYHVLHSGSINAQVDHYLTVLGAASPWWQDGPFLVQLDCERWPTDFPGEAAISAWCARFVAVTGGTHRPIVYASRGQYGNTLWGVDYPLWNAAYPSGASGTFRSLYPGDDSASWSAYSGHIPAIWQYSSDAVIGSQSTCDANAYRGSLAELSALTLMEDDMTPEQDQKLTAINERVLSIISGRPSHTTTWSGKTPDGEEDNVLDPHGIVSAGVSVTAAALAAALAAQLIADDDFVMGLAEAVAGALAARLANG